MARPQPTLAPSCFAIGETMVAPPAPGELVARVAYASVDPYLRLYMTEARSGANLIPLGGVIPGFAVAQVISSRNRGFTDGDWVVGRLGWQEIATSDGEGLRPFDPSLGPLSTALGVLGMPGLTAWAAIRRIARPACGDTLYISSAAGSVGSLAGQLARLAGCRVIGSTGNSDKLPWLEEIGIEAFDYKVHGVASGIAELAPDGVDIVFDNVGGSHLEFALESLRRGGLVIACGGISQYDSDRTTTGPRNLHLLFTRSLTVRGFSNADFTDDYPACQQEISALIRSGEVQYRETIFEGLEAAPAAMIKLLVGETTGKVVLHVGGDG